LFLVDYCAAYMGIYYYLNASLNIDESEIPCFNFSKALLLFV